VAGRPVTLRSRFAVSTSSDDTSLGQHVPSADVLWKCATIAVWASTFANESTAANLDGGTVLIRVNGAAVFEARLHGKVSQARNAFSLVVPWGDGLRFTAGEVLDWYVSTPWAMSGLVDAGFLGTYEPEV
jgi:hypothetical protein